MPRHEPPIPWPELLRMLRSPDPEDRKEGWRKLYHGLRGGRIHMTQQRADKLLSLPPEKDAAVQELIEEAMLLVNAAMGDKAVEEKAEEVISAPFAPPAAEPKVMPQDSLGRWIWLVFLEPSIIAQLTDTRSRDERAVRLIARVLDLFTFPKVMFQDVELGSFSLPVLGTASVDAVCFVGRHCLFFDGPATLADWEWKEARYRFARLDPRQSPSVPWPDPRLHRINEFVGPGIIVPHSAQLEGDQLTDYGLIQRYVAVVNGHPIVVVVCAGCTFVGTYAAAYWAASYLFEKHGAKGLIPHPDRLAWDSSLETVVKVTAQLDPKRVRPPQVRVEPVDVRCDGWAWCLDSFQWERPSPKHAALYYPEGEAPSPASVTEVWLDGKPANLEPDSENRRLLIAACLKARANGPIVSIRGLADDTTIWADGQPRTQQYVRGRLSNLKRYLNRSLELGRGSSDLRLNLEVHAASTEASTRRWMSAPQAEY